MAWDSSVYLIARKSLANQWLSLRFLFFPSPKYHHMRDFKNWVHDDSLKVIMSKRGKTRGKTIGDSLNCRWFLRLVMSWTSQVAGKWSPQQRASCQQLRVPRHPSGPSLNGGKRSGGHVVNMLFLVIPFCPFVLKDSDFLKLYSFVSVGQCNIGTRFPSGDLPIVGYSVFVAVPASPGSFLEG